MTMYHSDLPLKLHEKGGWGNRKTVDTFERYAKILFENYGDRVKYWLTINEQNVMINHPNAMNLGRFHQKRIVSAMPSYASGRSKGDKAGDMELLGEVKHREQGNTT